MKRTNITSTFAIIAATYLALLGTGGGSKGILLWPVAAAHAVFLMLLTPAWLGAAKHI